MSEENPAPEPELAFYPGDRVQLKPRQESTARVYGQGQPLPGVLLNGTLIRYDTIYTCTSATDVAHAELDTSLCLENENLFNLID